MAHGERRYEDRWLDGVDEPPFVNVPGHYVEEPRFVGHDVVNGRGEVVQTIRVPNPDYACAANGEVMDYDPLPEEECADRKVPYERRIVTEYK